MQEVSGSIPDVITFLLTKSTPFRDMSKVRCHKCGGVGHIHPHCPTQDSDVANIVIDDDKEAQAFTVIADDLEVAW